MASARAVKCPFQAWTTYGSQKVLSTRFRTLTNCDISTRAVRPVLCSRGSYALQSNMPVAGGAGSSMRPPFLCPTEQYACRGRCGQFYAAAGLMPPQSNMPAIMPGFLRTFSWALPLRQAEPVTGGKLSRRGQKAAPGSRKAAARFYKHRRGDIVIIYLPERLGGDAISPPVPGNDGCLDWAGTRDGEWPPPSQTAWGLRDSCRGDAHDLTTPGGGLGSATA